MHVDEYSTDLNDDDKPHRLDWSLKSLRAEFKIKNSEIYFKRYQKRLRHRLFTVVLILNMIVCLFDTFWYFLYKVRYPYIHISIYPYPTAQCMYVPRNSSSWILTTNRLTSKSQSKCKPSFYWIEIYQIALFSKGAGRLVDRAVLNDLVLRSRTENKRFTYRAQHSIKTWSCGIWWSAEWANGINWYLLSLRISEVLVEGPWRIAPHDKWFEASQYNFQASLVYDFSLNQADYDRHLQYSHWIRAKFKVMYGKHVGTRTLLLDGICSKSLWRWMWYTYLTK